MYYDILYIEIYYLYLHKEILFHRLEDRREPV